MKRRLGGDRVIYGFCVNKCGKKLKCSDDLTISVNPDADVKFTVMTSLRNAVKGKCGTDINVNAWRDISVMEWVVNKMNDANFTDVVKIVSF
ncbi:hypothetical protein MAR_012228 [Mya arenaria]|uniref:Uncharacterized protein n=1 Tax=Mya arenaria TaxID=6604 RepID=A0ABY7FZZ1_MYAAR|nr:hypothetical protein MAR_012228 [Mya arenaria]